MRIAEPIACVTLPTAAGTSPSFFSFSMNHKNMTLADFAGRAFGPPHRITHVDEEILVSSAGAVTQKRADGTGPGLLERIPLYAVSAPATPDKPFILSHEELVEFLSKDIVESLFPEEVLTGFGEFPGRLAG
jgi:hypothetical protein